MAPPDLDATWTSTSVDSISRSFRVCMDVTSSEDETYVLDAPTSSVPYECSIPKPPPPFPSIKTFPRVDHRKRSSDCCSVPKEIQASWDRLFKEGCGADVYILTEGKSYIPAHSSFLSMASPMLGSLLQQSKVKNGIRHIRILGVPGGAVYTFIQFLYSSCYEEEEMQKFVLHLLVLSHAFSVPCLKRLCMQILEECWLTKENVIDVLQLARNCDAPRLCFVCVRMVIKEFKSVSSTEGWKVMKRSNPALEQELVESVVEADSRKQERSRKIEERKVYLLLYEAMKALLHICRDGCSTIGPRDRVLKGSQISCTFPACKGLEALLRHFSTCKARIPGGCGNCKRMWQLLELHSRICDERDSCKVPLCRSLKEKMQVQTKKDEAKWKLLVSRVAAAKNSLGPFSAPHMDNWRASQF